jgi:two-component system sensor histidine kinase YesM
MLYKFLKSEDLPGVMYVVDKDNIIIAQSDRQTYVYGDTEFVSFDTVERDPRQVVLNNSIGVMDGWQVICVLDRDFMAEAFRINWTQMFTLILVVTVFASIVIYAISVSFYKRIAMIVDHMGKLSKEEYVLIPEDKKGSDEIGTMISSTNSLIIKIRSLIEDVYKAKLRDTQLELLQKQSELSAFQCQVNPHFMFNVLETIRIKSYLRNEFETSRIIKYMSKIFRKLLLWNQDLIELREEINFIQEYLQIQQYRYEDELDFEINVDESLLSLKIPKMTLQTLIDNACEHGFSETKGLKKIRVSISKTDSEVVFKVYDNGNGMTPEQIQQVQDMSNEENKGIGIKNVIGRLNLYFGGKYTFRITSKPGEFTEILLILDLEELRRGDYV